ncbi:MULTISPECIES: AAA family ATPase [Sanguibacteroides]|uniref:ABC transporter ATP-binding protein n=1 Tax=Sanguibacteroides justesenii TaxID=1547597 RepID=A0AB34R2Z4_9PORP|nr:MULTISPECIES: AAA family ATPase [Sanguibacteroides]KIO45414.1 ABC transporter ATP-binding protein [Sanguibacteroides justesenii]
MKANKIQKIEIRNVWGKYNFRWENLNPDVNILTGINGSGKTTFFNVMDALLSADVKRLRNYNIEAEIIIDDIAIPYNRQTTPNEIKQKLSGFNYMKISTFDVPLKDRRKMGKEDSPLLSELKEIVYSVGENNASFSDYRLKATNFPEQAEEINTRIRHFYDTVNHLFAGTGKTIEIDPMTNQLIFKDGKETIHLHKLSSGEKQLLIILLRVFLMDGQPYVLLMDEPEISLHIEWQYRLFEEIQKLNPCCQIITSTHSPSLFGDGWGDKLVFIEDLIVQ